MIPAFKVFQLNVINIHWVPTMTKHCAGCKPEQFLCRSLHFYKRIRKNTVNTGWTLSAIRKMQETTGIQRRERFCEVWNRDKKGFMETVIFEMGIEEQVSF